MFLALVGLAVATIIAICLYLQQKTEPRDSTKLHQDGSIVIEKEGRAGHQKLSSASSMENPDGDQTPKASPATISAPVPTFDLSQSVTAPLGNDDQIKTTSAIPAATTQAGPGLMPPPPPRIPMLPKLGGSNPNGSLRAPSSSLTPNRGPTLAPNNPYGSIKPGAVANTAGKRNKVILEPGHSPLDWAALAKSTDLSGVPRLQRVTPSMLRYHHGRKGRPAWSSYRGKVYNITPYLPFHPGGEGELMRAAGKDGEKLFNEVHSWVNWDTMLSACVVGVMVSEGHDDGLDEMD